MEVQDLKIGRPLEVSITRESFIYHFVSTIEEVEGRTIYVTLITGRTGSVFRFMPGDRVSIIYRLEDRLWQWKNVSGGVELLDGDRVHSFTVRKSQGDPYNRREAYRVFFGEETDFRRRVPDVEKMREYRRQHPEIKDISELQNVEECYKTLVIPGLVKDVSETGVGLYSSEKIPEDCELSFVLPTRFGLLDCKCTPVRSTIDTNSMYRYFYGCRITSVSNNIVKILINLQRQQLAMLHKD